MFAFKPAVLGLVICMIFANEAHAQAVETVPAEAAVASESDQPAIAEISAALDAITEAWRQADFVESSRWMSEEGWFTFNGTRRPMAEVLERVQRNRSGGFAGQWIGDFDVRYDILAPNVVVTTWENDFARIMPDGSQLPTEVALMTLVWTETTEGWRIAHYHESTRPKADTE